MISITLLINYFATPAFTFVIIYLDIGALRAYSTKLFIEKFQL